MLDADCEIGCHADIPDISPPPLIMNQLASLRLMQAGLESSLPLNKQVGQHSPRIAIEPRQRLAPCL
jgi:hypothetical protein